MPASSSVNFGLQTFNSYDQSIFFSDSLGVFETKIGGTTQFDINLSPRLFGFYFDMDLDIELGIQAGFKASAGGLNSSVSFDIGAELEGGLRGDAGEAVKFISGTGSLARVAFDTVPIGLTAYVDLLYGIAGLIKAGYRTTEFFDPIEFDTRDTALPKVEADPTDNIDDDLNALRLLNIDLGQVSFLQNIFYDLLPEGAPGTEILGPYLFEINGLNQKMVVQGNLISPAPKVTVAGETVSDFPEVLDDNGDKVTKPDGLDADISIDLASLQFKIPETAPAANSTDSDSDFDGVTLSATDAQNFLEARLDLDGILSYALWHGSKIPFFMEVSGPESEAWSVKAVLADIDAGIDWRLREDFALTPQALEVTLEFFSEATGNPIHVDVTEDGVTKRVSSWTGEWENLPAFSVTEPTIVRPTSTTSASLDNRTGVELGLALTAQFLRLNYEVEALRIYGNYGPAIDLSLTEDDLFPGFADIGFLPIFDQTVSISGYDRTELPSFLIDIASTSEDFDPGRSGIISDFNTNAPTALDDDGFDGRAFAVNERDTLELETRWLLANDFDLDAYDTLTISSVASLSPHADVTLGSDGKITVTAGTFDGLSSGETTDMQFEYTVRDARGKTDTATVTIEVTGELDRPETRDDVFQRVVDLSSPSRFDTVEFGSLIANDIDRDGSLYVQSVGTRTTAFGAEVEIRADGTFSYTPAPAGTGTQPNTFAGAYGVDTFTYIIGDRFTYFTGGTVSIVTVPLEAGDGALSSPSVLIRSADSVQNLYGDDAIVVDEGAMTQAYIVLTEAPTRDVRVDFLDLERQSLTSAPVDAVTATVMRMDADGALVPTDAPTQAFFTPENWNIPQVVHLYGIPDAVASGRRYLDLQYDVVPNGGAAANYAAVTGRAPMVVGDPAEILLSADRIVVEEGSSFEIGVSLSKAVAIQDGRPTDVYLDLTFAGRGKVDLGALSTRENGLKEVDGSLLLKLQTSTALTLPMQALDDLFANKTRFAELTLSVNTDLTTAPSFKDALPVQLTIEIRDDEPIAPMAVDDEVFVNEDETVTFDALANDIDHNLGDTFEITSASARNGTVEIDPVDFKLTYTPNENFNGTDIITYIVADADGLTDTGRVDALVYPVNDAPVARYIDPLIFAFEDEPIRLDLNTMVTDIDGDDLVFFIQSFDTQDQEIVFDPDDLSVISAGAEASIRNDILTLNLPLDYFNTEYVRDADGNLVRDPDDGNALYQLIDGASPFQITYGYREAGTTPLESELGLQTIDILIAPRNDAPRTKPDFLEVDANADLRGIEGTILANDSDIEGDAFKITELTHSATRIVSGTLGATMFPEVGGAPVSTAFVGTDGSVNFSPSHLYERLPGYDTLGEFEYAEEDWTYTVVDAAGEISTETVTFRIRGVEDPIVPGEYSYRVTLDDSYEFGQDQFIFGPLFVKDTSVDFARAEDYVLNNKPYFSDRGVLLDIYETAVHGRPGAEAAYVVDRFDRPAAYTLEPGEVIIDTFTYEASTFGSSEYYTAEVHMIVTGGGATPDAAIVVSRSAISVKEGGAQETFAVALTKRPTEDVVVLVEALLPSDVEAVTTELVFTPDNWAETQRVTVAAVDDNLPDGDVTSTLSLHVDADRSDDAFDSASATVQVTTLDADPAREVRFSDIVLEVKEGGSSGSFMVSLGEQPRGLVQVFLENSDPTAATLSKSTISFLKGTWDTPQEIRVTAVDDDVIDGLNLSLITATVRNFNVADADFKTAPPKVLVLVEDNDELPPPPVVSIQSDTVTQDEADSGVTTYSFTVTRTGADLSTASTVSYAVVGEVFASVNPAQASDFQGGTLPSGTVTFGPDETEKTISIAVAGDGVFEANEAFEVRLSNPFGAELGNTVARGDIINDDALPVLAPDSAITRESTGILIDVLANDTGSEIPVSSLGVNTHSSSGTAEIREGGIFYTPGEGFIGTDTFIYLVSPSSGIVLSQTVTVMVKPVNNAPDLFTQYLGEVSEAGPAISFDVLSSVTDPDGDSVTATSATASFAGGVLDVELLGNRTILFDPAQLGDVLDSGDTAQVTISFTTDDGNGGVTSGNTLTLDVIGEDDINVIFDTLGSGRLNGTGGADLFEMVGGGLDTIRAMAGRDMFDLSGIIDNGRRDVIRILDYEEQEMLMGIGMDDVQMSRERPGQVQLLLNGNRDMVILDGIDSLNDVAFEFL